MDVRLVVCVTLLFCNWGCDASGIELTFKNVVTSSVHALAANSEGEFSVAEKNNELCKMCEQFTSDAVEYISANKTQTEIIDIFISTCSRLGAYKTQCTALVNYYAPLFFMEISSIQPETFCEKVNLCQEIAILFYQIEEDSCSICHRAMSELMLKLKDPDTQLDIIELLLKACNSIKNYAAKCKRMVFEYGPIFLANAEKFIEKTDVCNMLHACSDNIFDM